MNLLPKSHKDFSKKDYWNKFFKKRGITAFEWYGEYMELCNHLHKYIKPTNNILIVGCGNSRLSADMYDVGYYNITNIDVSDVVIKQMKHINVNRRRMRFICMDATNTCFKSEEFHVVLDKGTLDALMPDDSEETQARIDKYFSEIKRVLKFGGRYVCISLLQTHILRKLLEVFCDRSWMFRIVRCHDAEEKNAKTGDGIRMPVFAVIATKFKEMPEMILEVCLAGIQMIRLTTPEELSDYIKLAQDAAFVTNGLAKTNLDDNEEVMLDLMKPGEDTPRYTLYIVDQKEQNAVNKYAVFVVPQGRESEWMFSTPEGRRHLQETAQFRRLVIAILRRGQHFESLEAVKEELAHSTKMLIPYAFYGQIPFLSIGDVGRRVKVHEGSSPTTGPYVVEDVDVEGTTYRRLMFLDNQFLVQSEVKLKTVKRKNKTKFVVDFGHLSVYHTFMCVGVEMSRGEQCRVAVLGLGGGGLCMFLRKCYEDAAITAVELDPCMLDIAKNHFELKTDEKLQVQIKDGLEFLRDEVAAGRKYESVMFDMDSKDRTLGLSCPPRPFLDQDAMANVKALLGDDGHFILNLVCRDTELRSSILETVKANFSHVVSNRVDEEVNEIIFATNSSVEYSKEAMEAAAKSINNVARSRNVVKTKCVALWDFMECINVIS